MFGTIEHLACRKGAEGDRPTFGFIRGDDNISRFFIPTGLQATTIKFDDMKVGMRVEFSEIEHPKGPRAIEVRVVG